MSERTAQLDLPGLQRRLDSLDVGQRLTLALTDYRRLFGVNDVAHERVALFARGHSCELESTPSAITFRRTSQRPA